MRKIETENGPSSAETNSRGRVATIIKRVTEYPKRVGTRLLMPHVIEAGVSMLEFDESSRENIALLKEPLSKGYKLIIAASHQSQ